MIRLNPATNGTKWWITQPGCSSSHAQTEKGSRSRLPFSVWASASWSRVAGWAWTAVSSSSTRIRSLATRDFGGCWKNSRRVCRTSRSNGLTLRSTCRSTDSIAVWVKTGASTNRSFARESLNTSGSRTHQFDFPSRDSYKSVLILVLSYDPDTNRKLIEKHAECIEWHSAVLLFVIILVINGRNQLSNRLK